MINFKTEKEPKMKFFDFGAFQNKMQIPSHDKIIFHVLFGAFHITFRKDVNATVMNIYSNICRDILGSSCGPEVVRSKISL